MTLKSALLAGLAVLSLGTATAQAKPITGIGISLGTLGNPYFVALAKAPRPKRKRSHRMPVSRPSRQTMT